MLTSAPAFKSRSISRALPLIVASWSGVTPSLVRAPARAPAFRSISAMSRSSRSTAQCSAVLPSVCAAFTSALRASAARTASRSPRIAASARSAGRGYAVPAATRTKPASDERAFRRLDEAHREHRKPSVRSAYRCARGRRKAPTTRRHMSDTNVRRAFVPPALPPHLPRLPSQIVPRLVTADRCHWSPWCDPAIRPVAPVPHRPASRPARACPR